MALHSNGRLDNEVLVQGRATTSKPSDDQRSLKHSQGGGHRSGERTQLASAIGKAGVLFLMATAAAGLLCIIWTVTVHPTWHKQAETFYSTIGISRVCDHVYKSAASWLTGKPGEASSHGDIGTGHVSWHRKLGPPFGLQPLHQAQMGAHETLVTKTAALFGLEVLDNMKLPGASVEAAYPRDDDDLLDRHSRQVLGYDDYAGVPQGCVACTGTVTSTSGRKKSPPPPPPPPPRRNPPPPPPPCRSSPPPK